MSNEIEKKDDNAIKVNNEEIISSIVLNGDLSKLTPIQKVEYYNNVCQSLGLNPLTKPFDIIKIQGKEVLYAKKDCTEQLRKINGISVIDQDDKIINDIYIINVKVQDKSGRLDTGKGAVSIKGLFAADLANAIMKAETKAKRRATLSISGLGIVDEIELDVIPEINSKDESKIFSNLKKADTEINNQAKTELGLTDIADDTPGFEDIEVIDGSTAWSGIQAKREVKALARDLNKQKKLTKEDIEYFTPILSNDNPYDSQEAYFIDLDRLNKIAKNDLFNQGAK